MKIVGRGPLTLVIVIERLRIFLADKLFGTTPEEVGKWYRAEGLTKEIASGLKQKEYNAQELKRARERIVERHQEATGCGIDFGELLCYEIHTTGLHFRALAAKWEIPIELLGDLIADHCRQL